MSERKLFCLKGTPDPTCETPMRMIEVLLNNAQQNNAVVSNGHASLIIPGKTLKAIKYLPHRDKIRIIESMYRAIQDSGAIFQIPKE